MSIGILAGMEEAEDVLHVMRTAACYMFRIQKQNAFLMDRRDEARPPPSPLNLLLFSLYNICSTICIL